MKEIVKACYKLCNVGGDFIYLSKTLINVIAFKKLDSLGLLDHKASIIQSLLRNASTAQNKAYQ